MVEVKDEPIIPSGSKFNKSHSQTSPC